MTNITEHDTYNSVIYDEKIKQDFKEILLKNRLIGEKTNCDINIKVNQGGILFIKIQKDFIIK